MITCPECGKKLGDDPYLARRHEQDIAKLKDHNILLDAEVRTLMWCLKLAHAEVAQHDPNS